MPNPFRNQLSRLLRRNETRIHELSMHNWHGDCQEVINCHYRKTLIP